MSCRDARGFNLRAFGQHYRSRELFCPRRANTRIQHPSPKHVRRGF
ncbi:MAG: hypothetical protein HN736_14595 [Anaerolineae bacterium]|nr:hypothetical protein [Anaerolineae bacterium]MBT3714429.1 hypothetical protein [Anaerolineae bacterium]MBT4309251.1 hypothetical protein [Anaerolineae bacterium]MBT4458518.1 hypothetical protein [Anaerolineae bacterium]MBT6062063.1 hypothetical protein [Anaerolineae bacterium]